MLTHSLCRTASATPPASVPQQRLLAERRWRLGMHARGHPSALMAELYRVLQVQGVAWKKIAPYNLKCRKVIKLASPRHSMSGVGLVQTS